MDPTVNCLLPSLVNTKRCGSYGSQEFVCWDSFELQKLGIFEFEYLEGRCKIQVGASLPAQSPSYELFQRGHIPQP